MYAVSRCMLATIGVASAMARTERTLAALVTRSPIAEYSPLARISVKSASVADGSAAVHTMPSASTVADCKAPVRRGVSSQPEATMTLVRLR